MSKTFIAEVVHDSAGITGVAANAVAGGRMAAIGAEMKRRKRFTLAGPGSFKLAKTRARKARNPRTGEPIKVAAGDTVRFNASPTVTKVV